MKSRAFASRRLKKAEAPAAAVPPPVPMAEPTDGGMFSGLKTETLGAVVKVLSQTKELENDKAAQQLIIEATEELNSRPPVVDAAPPAAAPAPAAPAAPVTASRKLHHRRKANGGFFTQDLDVEEGKSSEVPELSEAHAAKSDKTGITRPATEPIGKFAGNDMTTGSALKKSQDLGEKLKALYLDAKILTSVNDTRPVRDAVEAIYHAAKKFEEAVKVFNKTVQQEEAEADAAKDALKDTKKSSFLERTAAKKAAQPFEYDEDGNDVLSPEQIKETVDECIAYIAQHESSWITLNDDELYDLVSEVAIDHLSAGVSIHSWSDARHAVMTEIQAARKQWENRTTGIDGTHSRLGSEEKEAGAEIPFHPYVKNAPKPAPEFAKDHDRDNGTYTSTGYEMLHGKKKGAFGGLVLASTQKTALQMRPMAKQDRYGLQGTEDFSDGTSPYIGEIAIPDWPEAQEGTNTEQNPQGESLGGATIVADKNGIAIVGVEAEFQLDYPEAQYGKDGVLDKAEEICSKPVTIQELRQMGFIQIAGYDAQAGTHY